MLKPERLKAKECLWWQSAGGGNKEKTSGAAGTYAFAAPDVPVADGAKKVTAVSHALSTCLSAAKGT